MSFVIFDNKKWSDILKHYPKPCDDLKEEIWEKTRNFYILKNIDLSEASKDFDDLRKMKTSDLIKKSDLFSRYEYKWNLGDTYIDFSNIGNKSSNYFHQENRYKCDSINAPSPYRTWYDKKFFFTLLNALWTLKVKEVNDDTLRSCIALRKYIASQFRPSAAKTVYEHFQAKNVLDFSAGWGDRLSAAMGTDNLESYIGIDPNKKLLEGYEGQIKHFSKNKTIKLLMDPAEDVLGSLNYQPDLVFTSPPYFVVERYSSESTQSWKRYKKLNNWLSGFLFPVIEKSWSILKEGGHMAINISDVYCNHTINKICDPMNDFISTFKNSEKCDNLNYRMAKRINSKSEKKGIFVEPIWVWKKI